MHLQTHILSGWCIANCLPLSPRQRLCSMLAATLPDLDGLGMLISEDYYVRFHHVVGHNLFFGLLISASLALACTRRIASCILSFTLFFALFHLHLILDYFGSGRAWTIKYFWPANDEFFFRFRNAWPFDSWQNISTFAFFLVCTLVIAVHQSRTPLEAIMPRLDKQLVALLRKPFTRAATALPYAIFLLPFAI